MSKYVTLCASLVFDRTIGFVWVVSSALKTSSLHPTSYMYIYSLVFPSNVIVWLSIAIDCLSFTSLTDAVSFDSRLRNCISILSVGVAVSVIFFTLSVPRLLSMCFESLPCHCNVLKGHQLVKTSLYSEFDDSDNFVLISRNSTDFHTIMLDMTHGLHSLTKYKSKHTYLVLI